MLILLNGAIQAIKKRKAYLHTRKELRSLPLNTALDLDIYPGDAGKIAWNAVYGH